MRKISLLLVFIVTLGVASEAQSRMGEFRVEILDEQLADIIREYIDETKTDVKHRIIALRIVTGGKKCVTITNEISDAYKIARFAPTNYCVLDGKALILIYASIDNLFRRNLKLISQELDREIKRLEITLVHIDENDLSLTYTAPTWRLTEEVSGFALNKKVSPHELDVIPPGYAIVRDSIDTNSFLLIKR